MELWKELIFYHKMSATYMMVVCYTMAAGEECSLNFF